MNTSLSVSTTLSKISIKAIQDMLMEDILSFPMENMRTRMKLLDLAYLMENDEGFRRTNASKIVQQLYNTIQIPILQPNIDAAHAYLVGTFLSGNPIFGVVSDTFEKSPIAKQMEAIIAENSEMTGWARQLSLWFKDGLKYNIAALEAEWWSRNTFKFTTDTNISLTNAVAKPEVRSGNELKSLNMYNTYYDTTVSPADVSISGSFVLNIDVMNRAQVQKFLTDLLANGATLLKTEKEIHESVPKRLLHHIPKITSESAITPNGTDWTKFVTTPSHTLNAGMNVKGKFEVITYYRRIIPNRLGIANTGDGDAVQVWKFFEINGELIYAERKTNAHSLIPVFFLQPTEDNLGYQSKGLGDNLLPFQKFASTLAKARIASLQRGISDRGLYDPSRVSEKDINSVVPAAKIPVKPAAYGKPLSEAYYPFPFRDEMGASFNQEISNTMQWAEQAAKINKAQRGQFVKGNRTLQEYQDTMGNADAPQQAQAILINAQGIVPLKHVIKINILQYQAPTEIPNPETAEPVSIDPVELRKSIIQFKIADGLVPKDRILNLDQYLNFFQIASQTEGANQEYDLIGMLAYVLEERGAKLSQFKRQQLQQFANPAQQQGGQATSRGPEQVPQQVPGQPVLQ
jgi:hypothetical protein